MINVLDHGADPTGGADALAAFEAAIEAAALPQQGPYDGRGGVVLVPAGDYRLSGQLRIRRRVTLWGEGGFGRLGASRITLEQAAPTMTGDATAHLEICGLDGQSPLRASHTTLRGLEIRGDIYAWAPVHLDDVQVKGGIWIDGTDAEHAPGLGEGAVRNANGWSLRMVRVEDAADWGVKITGQDANGGRALGVDVIGCAHGILDSAFLSSTWIGCTVECFGGQSIRAEGVRKTFISCYVELGSDPIELTDKTQIWIGGNPGPGFATSEALILRDGQVTGLEIDDLVSQGIIIRQRNAANTREVITRVAPPGGRSFLEFQLDSDPGAIEIRDDDQWLDFLRYEGRVAAVRAAGANATVGPHTVDPGTVHTRDHLEGQKPRWVGQARDAGTGHPDVDPSGPTGNRPWIDGDRLYDSHPTTHVGWLRVGGVWRRFGVVVEPA